MRGNDFEEAAEKYRDHIYAVAFNFFRNSSDADDVVQDVLLKLYRSRREFESDEHVRNWLLRVAVNQCRKNIGLFLVQEKYSPGGIRRNAGI